MPTTARKKTSFPGEVILRKSEPGQRRDHHAAHGGDRRDDGAVQQVAQEGLALEDFEVVAEVEPVVGGDLQRHALDFRRGFQRRDRHPEKREEDDDGAAGNREGNEPADVDLLETEASRGATARSPKRRNSCLARYRKQWHRHGPLQYSTGFRKSRHCSNVTSMSVTKTKTAITEASPKRKNLKAVSYSSMMMV